MTKLTTLSLILLLSSCTWRGYISPTESDFKAVNDRDDAYELGTQNFDETNDQEALRIEATISALNEVQYLFDDERFAEMMGERSWAAACDQDPIPQVSGEEVVRDLRALDVKISVFPEKPFRAIGLTDITNYRIAIAPSRIDDYSKDEIVAASNLIETVAHEISHLVLLENGWIKYRDRGHGKPGCTKDDLVSYRVGRAIQALWISDRVPSE